MENKDYNPFEGDYCAPEEEPVTYSEKPHYETAEEYNQARREREESQTTDYSQFYNTENYNNRQNSQSYNNQQYTSSQYNNQQFTNLGGTKVDSEGKPMQNLFAVQLIFAIVEILLCCFSPTTMVLAIIALVFAIQANTAYAHSKEIDFKVKSKVANILLIIGGAFMIVSIVSTLFFSAVFMTSAESIINELEQEYSGDLGAFFEELEEYGDDVDAEPYEEQLSEGDVPLVEGFADFTLNGVSYSVPMSYADFSKMGYTLEEGYENYILEAGQYESIIINGDDGYMVGMIRVSNDTNVVLPLEECVVDYICLQNDAAYYDDIEPLDVTFGNGLDMNSSYEDVKAFFGDPAYVYIDEESQYENYSWYYNGEDMYQLFDIYFSEGKISEICIEQYEYTY